MYTGKTITCHARSAAAPVTTGSYTFTVTAGGCDGGKDGSTTSASPSDSGDRRNNATPNSIP